MFNKVVGFLEDHKDGIKNGVLIVTVCTSIIGIMALGGVHRLNGIIEENGLNELFYGDIED